jgi:hypothetical protein
MWHPNMPFDPHARVPTLMTATGPAVAILGTICGTIKVGTYTVQDQTLYVIRDLVDTADIILGLDWMRGSGWMFWP